MKLSRTDIQDIGGFHGDSQRPTGKANQEVPDDQILAFACAENRAVLTINRKHFIRLHRKQQDHSGIIVCTFDLDFTRQAKRIHEAIEPLSTLDNQLIRVIRPSR